MKEKYYVVHSKRRVCFMFQVTCLQQSSPPESRARDGKPGASRSTSSAWRHLGNHWSQLRFVGEAIGHVDSVLWIDDGHITAHLLLST